MQKFEHSSAVAQSAEFMQLAVDDIDQNISLLDAHMDDNANILLGGPTTWRILRQTVKTDELQVVGHI